MRLAYYAGASTAAAAACLLKAFHERPNFYSATVYLSQSNACLLILTNLLLMMAFTFIYGLQRILYGPLRPIEIEQLSEKAWYAVLDTLLAMPSFREDVGGWLLVMFVLLLAGKVWGWIAEGRVDILEQQPPANPTWFHIRLATSLAVSILFAFSMLDYCVESVIVNPRPGMMVIFTFEFAILSIFATFTMSRYLLSLIETAIVKKQTLQAIEVRKAEIRAEREETRQNQTAEASERQEATGPAEDEEPIEVDENEVDVPGWEEKRRYLFALEVLTDFLKLLIYVIFFSISVTFNGLPMHIMRDVYMTFVSFSKRVTDYVAYRKATSHMNARYPDATTEEIRGDACIVCREDMVAWEQTNTPAEPQLNDAQQRAPGPALPVRRDEGLRAKKLPCGHILHLRCLKAWLERQQVCPTCRRPVVTTQQPGESPNNAAANAQGRRQQAPGQNGRQNPFRLFNIGPIRLGFAQLPDDHLDHIVQQINQANGNDANAAAGPIRHVPEQAPAPAGPILQPAQIAQPPNSSTATNSAPSVHQESLQIQLMRIEQRIIQEAHNIAVEQQQLGALRAMEAELARLRTQHIPSQMPIGVSSMPQSFLHQLPGPPHRGQPVHSHDLLNGHSAQLVTNGHEHLPEGMVLPEGWTVMPLHRSGGVQVPTSTASAQTVNVAPGRENGSQQDSNGAPSLQPFTPIPPPSSQESGQASEQIGGPTDGNGSPLFVPSAPAAVSTATASEQAAASASTQASAPVPSIPQDASWTNDTWNFNDQSQDVSSAPGESQQPTAEESHEQSARIDKGKGRAVEVEDAPDTNE